VPAAQVVQLVAPDPATAPDEQPEQAVAALLPWKVPAVQLVHVVDPDIDEYVPAAQGAHEVWLVKGCELPAAHEAQAIAPELDEYCPPKQLMQAGAALDAEYNPAGQAVQLVALAVENIPGAQTAQTVEPVLAS